MAAWTWDEMIAAFVALGGVASNVRPGRGPRGQGLFCLDPASPACVRTPPNLLIAADQLALDEGGARLLPDAAVGTAERHFYERYYNSFSWRGSGEHEQPALAAAYAALAPEVRALVTNDLHLGNLLSPPHSAFDQFKRSRAIRTADSRTMMMPVVELVNHAPDASPYDMRKGVAVRGIYADEILVRYRRTDPFSVLQTWGFASPEPCAFSLLKMLPWKGRAIGIGRSLQKAFAQGGARPPEATVHGNIVQIPCLLLGDAVKPDAPRRLFAETMAQLGETDVGPLFDSIRQDNLDRLQRLRTALEGRSGEGEALLRKTCEFQLQAMAYCED